VKCRPAGFVFPSTVKRLKRFDPPVNWHGKSVAKPFPSIIVQGNCDFGDGEGSVIGILQNQMS